MWKNGVEYNCHRFGKLMQEIYKCFLLFLKESKFMLYQHHIYFIVLIDLPRCFGKVFGH